MDYYFHRTYRGPLKAIIFDWAGTTLDYGCMAPTVTVMALFAREGVPISIEEARTPMGAYKKDHIRQILHMPSVQARWRDKFGETPSEQEVERMYQNFIPSQLACLPDYAELIPGTLETVTECRKRGLKIGSTTGYTQALMAVLLKEAKNRGYEPDSTVCADQVRAGRPEPWMCLQNAINLGIYPMEAFVKVDDTLPGIEEGLNAGMWTIGLARSGNEIGLSLSEIEKLHQHEFHTMLDKAYRRMASAGAHFVVDSIADIPPILDKIDERLKAGDKP
jgi:phosphonoacetaldehyde hydrolase